MIAVSIGLWIAACAMGQQPPPGAFGFRAMTPCPLGSDPRSGALSLQGEPGDYSLPIVLIIEGDHEVGFIQDLGLSADTWNSVLGEEVFTTDGRRGQVAIVNELPNDKMPEERLATTWRYGPGDVWFMFVQKPMVREVRPSVMLHEMGHLLGLGHSKSAADLMYPSIGGAKPLSPADVAAAKKSIAGMTRVKQP
jgi:hypothetical protein